VANEKLPLRFERQEIYVESAALTGKELLPHEGYFRDNDGSWSIISATGDRALTVPFTGTAKRNERWNAPDPKAQEFARLIVTAVNHHEAMYSKLKKIATWLEKNATCLEEWAGRCSEFESIAENERENARNYRATAKNIRALLAEIDKESL
jgi:hypothetical protein